LRKFVATFNAEDRKGERTLVAEFDKVERLCKGDWKQRSHLVKTLLEDSIKTSAL